ncbi:MAG: MFS transporter [Alphaproteobacteria bacterium]|nr:MFS transporter [Alphaproteobacteria bacterium]
MISRLRLSWRDAYYGWFVVAACNGVAFITWGVTIFNQGVFLGVFVRDFGWSPATLSVGPVLFHLCAGMAGVWVGRIVDRRGPRLVLIVGAVLIGLGMIGFGMVREPWHTYPVFVLLGCGFTCIHTITLGKIITRWFVRHRVRAMAAATFGAGLGGAVLVPLNAAVIEGWGTLAGGVVLAAVTLVVIVPLALWIIKDGPEAVGQEPDGGLVPEESQTVDPDTDSHPWTVPEAMRTVAFWGCRSASRSAWRRRAATWCTRSCSCRCRSA